MYVEKIVVVASRGAASRTDFVGNSSWGDGFILEYTKLFDVFYQI